MTRAVLMTRYEAQPRARADKSARSCRRLYTCHRIGTSVVNSSLLSVLALPCAVGAHGTLAPPAPAWASLACR
jgi:hypothetical protein